MNDNQDRILDDGQAKEIVARKTRRSFLVGGAAAAIGLAGWGWLASSGLDDEAHWPLRRIFKANEKLAEGYFSDSHLAPEFPVSEAVKDVRLNEQIGMEDALDAGAWRLQVEGVRGRNSPAVFTLDDVKKFPKIEHVTLLKCIEGWSQKVHWGGTRFRDLAASFPAEEGTPYVSMETPDEEYYVGLDMASAMHPQTLLCYEMNGKPLTEEHGAPLRLVVPVKYGIKNIKRLGKITYTAERPDDYWAERGYDWYAGL